MPTPRALSGRWLSKFPAKDRAYPVNRSSSSAPPEKNWATLRCSTVRTPGEVRWASSKSQACRESSPALTVSSIWGRIPASARSCRSSSPSSSVKRVHSTANTAPTPIPAAADRGNRSRLERNFTPGSAARASPPPSKKGMDTGSKYRTPTQAAATARARRNIFLIFSCIAFLLSPGGAALHFLARNRG